MPSLGVSPGAGIRGRGCCVATSAPFFGAVTMMTVVLRRQWHGLPMGTRVEMLTQNARRLIDAGIAAPAEGQDPPAVEEPTPEQAPAIDKQIKKTKRGRKPKCRAASASKR